MDLTIISPCFNESLNLFELVKRTEKAVRSFDPKLEYEHILIDNASTDNSLEILNQLKKSFPQVRILKNAENVGVFSSIQRAMKESRGRWLVPFLASDMQDPPEVITQFLAAQISTNCDAVFGIRKKRHESAFLFVLRKVFYFILRNFISGKKYVSGTSEFCLIKRDVSLGLIEFDDPNPFLRIYLSKMTKNVEYVEFTMDARVKGKSSANLFTLLDDALNAFSIIMPSVFSRLIVFVIPTSIVLFFTFFVTFILSVTGRVNFFYVIVSLLFLLFSLVFFIQLLIGHYIFILHSQVRKRPIVQTQEL
jgi:glycosyltransferase involved in cell wall biosynthesis